MRWLWSIRIGRPALAALACVSALATAVVIHTGLARTPAQMAALAALRERRQLVAHPASTRAAAPAPASAPAPVTVAAPSSSGGGRGGGAGGDGPTGASAAAGSGAATPAPSPATTPTTSTTSRTTPPPDAGLPRVGHVFVIALSAPSYAAAFGARSQAPYLRSLVGRGTLLSHFRSLGHGELADELAMISGQSPNAATSGGCASFSEYPASAGANAAGEVAGSGCVYPESALTIGDQVTSDGKVWGAYVAGMGSTACQHPNSGAATDVALAGTEPGYDLIHNPFVFFHSVLDDGDCQNDDQDLSKLPGALARPASTPRFVYLGADGCADADPVPAPMSPPAASTTTGTTTSTTSTITTSTTTTGTATSTSTTASTPSPGAATPTAYGCPAGEPDGITAEDTFLKTWVPTILRSAAYRRNGVLVIAFAGSQPAGHPVTTGALVLSRYTTRGRRIATPYGPYALLRSLEDMLDDTPLAHAAGATSFAHGVL